MIVNAIISFLVVQNMTGMSSVKFAPTFFEELLHFAIVDNFAQTFSLPTLCETPGELTGLFKPCVLA